MALGFFFSYLPLSHKKMRLRLAVTFSCIVPCLLLLLPAPCTSQDSFVCSRAAYYGSPDGLGTPSGACGYGEFGRTINGGDVGAVGRLYRDGTGCGACYQVRCTDAQLCTEEGVEVVVTDHGEGDYTDFILSPRAFGKLAQQNMDSDLLAYGVIDVEYRRVSCQYPGQNLMFKIQEDSKFPDYLAIIMLYQAGQKDILTVELWEEDCQQWREMRRSYGAVWDIVNPPQGPLNLRFQASGDGEVKWVQAGDVIPSDWKAGVAYDLAIQL